MSDRALAQRSSTIPTNWAGAATNNKKKAQGRTPIHTGARSQVPDQKNPQGRKLTRSRERGKGSYTQGARGREGGMHISHYKNDLWGTFQILF